MSLSTRMAAFFLAALAVVMLGFSITLYFLARAYLYEEVDERLDAALQVLGAAADVKPNGLEWDANEHELHITIGVDANADEVRWLIVDGQGQRVASSRNITSSPAFPVPPTSPGDPLAFQTGIAKDGTLWRIKLKRLEAPLAGQTFQAGGVSTNSKGKATRYSVLILVSGLQLHPVHTTLMHLALALGGLSLTICVLAALLARWLCKRALKPVLRMAAAAQEIGPEELECRLPSPSTHDELEDLQQAFNGLLDRVQESYERQKSFTAEASHQLRTPLTAMLGHVEVALRRVRSAEEYRETLLRAEQQIKHMIRLVEALLFLARAEKEACIPELEMVNVYEWLESRLEKWHDHPRATDLNPELTDVPVVVRAHVGLLDQLFDNLLDNACKYSTPGSEITVRLRRVRDRVQLDIADSGCGMSAEELARIFEPFYRSPNARRLGVNGYGLGLAIVQRITAVLGGSVEVTSQVGIGSKFSMELPLASSEGKLHASAVSL